MALSYLLCLFSMSWNLVLIVADFGGTVERQCEWNVVTIPKISASEIGSVEKFYDKYSEAPVIITGLMDESWGFSRDRPFWDLDFLLDKCPDAQIPIMRRTSDTSRWAGLDGAGSMSLTDFANYVVNESQTQDENSRLYGFDLIVSKQCPRLMSFFKVPRFCNECLLQGKEVRSHFVAVRRNANVFAWPTMMIGPQGTKSDLHTDSDGLPFWMSLFKGRKHWRILPYSANYNLTGLEPVDLPPPFGREFRGQVLEEYHGGGTYLFDGFDPNFTKFPALCRAEMHEAILEAGEVIYVPNSAPHGVVNLESTIAITSNYFHPLDKSQRQWLDRNCGDTRRSHEFTPRVCQYMNERITHREANPGPQDDLDLETFLHEGFFLKNFHREL